MPIPVDSSTPAPVGTLDGRLRFPATDDRLAYETHGPNLPFLSQAGKTVVIYVDAAGSILADIVNEAGAAISNSALTVDNNSQIPQFFGPVGVEVLYARLNGGTAYPIYAWLQGRYNDYDAQFASDAARISALEASDAIEDARLDVLEALNIGSRLTAVESVNTSDDSRLDALDSLNLVARLGQLTTLQTQVDAINSGELVLDGGSADSSLTDGIDGGTP